MKNKIAILVVVLATLALASCSSKPLCPAYSSSDAAATEMTDSHV
jgi:predicted small lipoprotein YifL